MPTLRMAVLAAAAALAAGCAVNPATGHRELMTVSESQERRIGVEADNQVRKEQGTYSEKAALTAYVGSVGQKLAAKSDRPGIAYQFDIVDSSEINAFALPGGYVYVTRGILARICTEDELAAVLGHEIAHVAARHGAAQMSKAQAAQIGLLGAAVLTDPRYAAAVTDLAGMAVNLAMQGYSRDDEREADELGVKYAARAGYNPRGAVDLMESFKALETSEPSRVEQWFASHPRTSERIRNISQELDGMKRKHAAALSRPLRRDEYLRQVDGILYGESNSSGYVSGRRYIGVRDSYSLQIPEDWTIRLEGADVSLQGGSDGGRAEMRVETLARAGVAGDVAKDYARKAAGQGIEVLGPVTRASLPAGDGAVVKMRGKGKNGQPIIAHRLFLVRFDKSYVLTFIAPEEKAEALEPVFQKLAGSIKYLGPDDIASSRRPRLRLYTVAQGDTWASIASKEIGPRARAKDLAELNDRDPGSVPRPGLLIKIPPAEAAGS